MSKRLSVYLTDKNVLRYDDIARCAEAKGKTVVDELLDGYEKYVSLKKKMINSDKDTFKPFNLDLGYDTQHEFSFISFYGRDVFSDKVDENYFVNIYQGRKGSYLVYFLRDESWADYEILESLEEVADFIAYGIYQKRGLDLEYTEDGIQDEYLSIANKFCKQVGLVDRGKDVQFLEF